MKVSDLLDRPAPRTVGDLWEDLQVEAATVDLKKPWTMTASAWLYAKNVHEPWAMEISPMQYARMSQRQKAAYDKKRHGEWEASAREKMEWRKAVVKAWEDKKFDPQDRDVDPEAKSVIHQAMAAQRQAAEKAAKAASNEAKRITKRADLHVGDKVWHRIYGEGTVKKINPKSVILAGTHGRDVKVQLVFDDDLMSLYTARPES